VSADAQIQQQAARIEGLENLAARGNMIEWMANNPPINRNGNNGPVKRPRSKMNDPEKFDGTNLILYPQFEGLLYAKLEIDSGVIGNEKEKVWYGLKGGAVGRIYPWIVIYMNKPSIFTVSNFFRQMQLAFKRPDAKGEGIEPSQQPPSGQSFLLRAPFGTGPPSWRPPVGRQP
jgi:hypothetical protein